MRFFKENFLLSYLNSEYRLYSVFSNLSYMWNFGALSFMFLAIQVVSGIFLAMNYVASFDQAFLSLEHIMRDVNGGWFVRYIHANGASFFFLMVYFHIARGLFFGSYIAPRQWIWMFGIIIFLLMIITAFLGYVLPWGQMSFWAATVITNLVTAVPLYGQKIVVWLWGGYSVDHATLNRFFSLHYFLPFVLIFLVLLHVIFLHDKGSSNPLGVYTNRDKIVFNPYFTVKDLHSVLIVLLFLIGFISFFPNYLGHTDNYIVADALVTPSHIVPEWYFLPFYAILRSIPNKLGGIVVLLLAILILLLLPYITINAIKPNVFREGQKLFFWVFIWLVVLLGWLGGKPVEQPFLQLSQLFTIFYFLNLIFVTQFIVLVDMFTNYFWLYRTMVLTFCWWCYIGFVRLLNVPLRYLARALIMYLNERNIKWKKNDD